MTDKSYKNWTSMTDDALMEQIGSFVKHHRLEQNISQADLAEKAAISRSTLSLLESGKTVTLAILIRILRALGLLHVMDTFAIDKKISPLALARMEQKKRNRAGKSGIAPEGKEW
ncbi:MAG: hypothetical protein FMNOHCHN_00252 [Ignavibacteriaceae bacterium]|nr:hypothetical protein [Ignavibacteriaceae bacterium]